MIKQRQQLRASVRKEKEEELALFLEMKKREKERNDLLLNSSEEFDSPLGAKPGTSPVFNISSSTPAPPRKTGADDFLNSENDKNDYDWHYVSLKFKTKVNAISVSYKCILESSMIRLYFANC